MSHSTQFCDCDVQYRETRLQLRLTKAHCFAEAKSTMIKGDLLPFLPSTS